MIEFLLIFISLVGIGLCVGHVVLTIYDTNDKIRDIQNRLPPE